MAKIAKDLSLILGLNETVDQLALTHSVICHVLMIIIIEHLFKHISLTVH